MKARVASLLIATSVCSAFPAGAAVTFDATRHSVTFTALSTECGLDTELEFLFVGRDSDHDYEAMFMTEDPITNIVAAFQQAGIPTGRPYDARACRLWPVGPHLSIEPALTTLVREMRGGTIPAISYTGGSRDAKGIPEAETNSPSAFFALYNCSQSILQFDDSLEQSSAYGRFQPAIKPPKGERRSFTFTWSGTDDCQSLELKLAPGQVSDALRLLQEKSKEKGLDVLCNFSPDLTLKEAIAAAGAFATLDSIRLKFNGHKEGQFFFRAYLPLEKWRDRKERLAQPPEVHFLSDGTIRVTEITEDWSDANSIDPKLTVTEHPCASVEEAARLTERLGDKPMTVFLFAAEQTKLERLFTFRKLITSFIPNWYVFTE